MSYTLLACGYSTAGLPVLKFTPGDEPTLTLQETKIPAGANPSWLEQHSSDSSLVFATNELEDGRILAIKLSGLGEDGPVTGEIIANVSSGGASPAHLKLLKDSVLAANYMGGSTLELPISLSPFSIIETSPDTTPGAYLKFEGTGPRTDRQEASHPHEAYDNGDEVLIPDLGADKTLRISKGSNGWEVKDSIDYPAGSGPRHVLVYNGILYTVLELSSELSIHKFPQLPEKPTHLATISTFSTGKPPTPQMLAAEILLAPNKKLVFVSNRNDPSPEGDTIAVFSLPTSSDGTGFKLVREIRTGLTHIRGMNISKDGKYLAAAGSKSSKVKIYSIVDGSEDGELKEVASVSDLEEPVGIIWL